MALLQRQQILLFIGLKAREERALLKEVYFEKVDENTYNLALGDIDPDTGEVDYEADSRNGDTEKVFATVAEIISDFAFGLPNHWIYISGNRDYKTKAYRMALNRFLDELSTDFEIKGLIGDIDSDVILEEDYIKNKEYLGFLVRKRNNG